MRLSDALDGASAQPPIADKGSDCSRKVFIDATDNNYEADAYSGMPPTLYIIGGAAAAADIGIDSPEYKGIKVQVLTKADLRRSHLLPQGCILMDLDYGLEQGFDPYAILEEEEIGYPFIVCSNKASVKDVVSWIKRGASDFFIKPLSAEELLQAISSVWAEYLQSLKRNPSRLSVLKIRALSKREREVLRLLIQGNTNREIAENLNINIRTAEMHRHSMMKRLGVKRLTYELIVAAGMAFTL